MYAPFACISVHHMLQSGCQIPWTSSYRRSRAVSALNQRAPLQTSRRVFSRQDSEGSIPFLWYLDWIFAGWDETNFAFSLPHPPHFLPTWYISFPPQHGETSWSCTPFFTSYVISGLLPPMGSQTRQECAFLWRGAEHWDMNNSTTSPPAPHSPSGT